MYDKHTLQVSGKGKALMRLLFSLPHLLQVIAARLSRRRPIEGDREHTLQHTAWKGAVPALQTHQILFTIGQTDLHRLTKRLKPTLIQQTKNLTLSGPRTALSLATRGRHFTTLLFYRNSDNLQVFLLFFLPRKKSTRTFNLEHSILIPRKYFL